jgi:hypothetical protein
MDMLLSTIMTMTVLCEGVGGGECKPVVRNSIHNKETMAARDPVNLTDWLVGRVKWIRQHEKATHLEGPASHNPSTPREIPGSAILLSIDGNSFIIHGKGVGRSNAGQVFLVVVIGKNIFPVAKGFDFRCRNGPVGCFVRGFDGKLAAGLGHV